MKIMMNMTDCREDTDRFRDSGDVERYVTRLGFDGLELLHCPGGNPSFFSPGLVAGVHLRYWNDWVDLWEGNLEALKEEYGSLEFAKSVYRGLDREALLKPIREDLIMAEQCGASYVVFHVCDVKPVELLTYQFCHTDEQVADAAAEMINTLLDEREYSFEFLIENLWWPGLTMTRPEITRRLLARIHYPRKGIMLDTGHLMHTCLELETQEEAVDYILRQVDAHGALAEKIKGIHLNQSLTGDYVREMLRNQENVPEDYREREAAGYRHVFRIDRHLPFTTPKVIELIEQISPEYLTFEFITGSREEHERKVWQQWKALGR